MANPFQKAVISGVGSVIRSIFRPPPSELPKPLEKEQMRSAYGQPIPRAWGATRYTGDILWAGERRAVKTRTGSGGGGKKGGGKGGGGSSQEIWTYYQSFAVSLGRNYDYPSPATDRAPLLGIWFDSKPVLMPGAALESAIEAITADGEGAIAGLRFYPKGGREPGFVYGPSQPMKVGELYIDPLIPSGVAHTNLAYLVVEDMLLTNYGNRIPSVSIAAGAELGRESILGSGIDGLLCSNWKSPYRGSGNVNLPPEYQSHILREISERCGLTYEDMDWSIEFPVEGYGVTRKSTGRKVLEPLLQIVNHFAVEREGRIEFLDATQTAVTTQILESDLLPLEEGIFYRENHVEVTELPETVELTYPAVSRDYQANTARAKRVSDVTGSTNKLSIDSSATLDPEIAKRSVEQWLQAAWEERITFDLLLPPKYLALEPADLATLALSDDRFLTLRVTKTEVGADYTIRVEGIRESVGQWDSNAETDDVSVVRPPSVIQADPILYILDLPLVPGDTGPAQGFARLYWTATADTEDNWGGCTLVRIDPVTEEPAYVGYISSGAPAGRILNVLGDPASPWRTDTENTLLVEWFHGEDRVESVTRESLLQGSNAAIVVKANGDIEIIQFQTAVQNEDDDNWVLSNLFRGVRGTETMAYDHGADERILMISRDDARAITVPVEGLVLHDIDPNDESYTYTYVPITATERFANAPRVTHTPVGRAFYPFAPVHQKAVRHANGDLLITWVRRTRIGGELADSGPENVPLNEASEKYDLEVFNAAGDTVVRSVADLTSASYTYTMSDQTSDGFAADLTELNLKVYQLSAVVGRGFSRIAAVEIE